MFQFPLRGARGPVCPDLPPTLLPHAIVAAAPPRDRRPSLMLSGTAYLMLAGAGLGLSRAQHARVRPSLRTGPPPVVVEVMFDPAPPAPRSPSGDPGSTIPAFAAVPAAPAVPSEGLTDQIPEGIPLGPPAHGLSGLQPAGRPGGGPDGGGTGTGSGSVAPRSMEMSELRILRQVAPAYPVMARLAHVQGAVVLQMTIDAAGVPIDVRVLEGHSVFREEAIRAARQWRFQPARLDGRAVPATFRLTLDFHFQ